MQEILITERLKILKVELSDAGFIRELLNSKGWLKYIGNRNINSDADAERYIQDIPLKSYQKNNFGLYAIELISEKKLIGLCGLIKREMLEIPDLGFALLPQYEGKGYGYEAASSILKYEISKHLLDNIAAITLPNNINSINLLKKLGFNLVKEFMYEPTNELLLLMNLSVK